METLAVLCSFEIDQPRRKGRHTRKKYLFGKVYQNNMMAFTIQTFLNSMIDNLIGIRNQEMFICPQNTNSHISHYTKSRFTSYLTALSFYVVY